MNATERIKKSNYVVNLGLGGNILLAILKTLFGIIGHSPALLSDGINSTSDVAYYIIIKIFMVLSGNPPDKEHPYGHHQLESIAAVVVGAFVMTTGIAIFWTSINTVFELVTGTITFPGSNWIALFIAGFSIFLKIALYIYTKKTAKKTQNAALTALAYDHGNDILATSAATLGIIIGRIGLPWFDPLASCIVAIIIIRTGIKIIQESSQDLMDAVPSKELAKQIHELLQPIDGVIAVEHIAAHRFGPYIMINLIIGVNGDLTVSEGDDIATRVEQVLYTHLELVRTIYIHYHPAK
ncbi:MAG: cation transporter [Spirochaetales bacterium]|nr:cation transporter [Spirochaetales bacterium]